MARVFPISASSEVPSAVMLTDDGKVVAFQGNRPVDAGDSEALLELLLSAAVELDHAYAELKRGAELVSSYFGDSSPFDVPAEDLG